MAEVAEVVRGGAADVHLHDARGEGHEGVLPPRARVVQSKRHDGCERGHRARSIKALARGRRPSLLRDTIRLIRRNLYAAPRCARRRGPIDQRKIAAFARRKPWVQIPLGPYFPSTETRPTPTGRACRILNTCNSPRILRRLKPPRCRLAEDWNQLSEQTTYRLEHTRHGQANCRA